jgi:integrase
MATIRKRVWPTSSGEARESWRVDFTDQHGKRRHKQFRKKKDADRWLVEARGQVEDGTYTPDSASIRVGEACQLWLARCEQEGLERATTKQYRSHARLHIVPLLGNEKLSRLTTPMVEKFADDMLAGGRSRIMAKKVMTSLKSAIAEAQRRGLCAQNVASGVSVRLAKRHKAKVSIPSPDEIRALLAASTGRQKAMLVVVFSGLRASEIRGLRWQDVDFDRKLLLVRVRADMSGKLGALKSESSRRDIPMSPMLLNTLREWKLACPRAS